MILFSYFMNITVLSIYAQCLKFCLIFKLFHVREKDKVFSIQTVQRHSPQLYSQWIILKMELVMESLLLQIHPLLGKAASPQFAGLLCGIQHIQWTWCSCCCSFSSQYLLPPLWQATWGLQVEAFINANETGKGVCSLGKEHLYDLQLFVSVYYICDIKVSCLLWKAGNNLVDDKFISCISILWIVLNPRMFKKKKIMSCLLI